jgi:deazaflavin-dependent oxidoreductase (nitroreductase family)
MSDSSSAGPIDTPLGWANEHLQRYVETDGAEGHLWNGVPTLLLTYRGAKSGTLRRTPLIYGTHGDAWCLVASKGGAPAHPLWFQGLMAHPGDVHIQAGADHHDVAARTATPEEKAAIWPTMVAIWPAFDEYQAKTDRDIPVVVLEAR